MFTRQHLSILVCLIVLVAAAALTHARAVDVAATPSAQLKGLEYLPDTEHVNVLSMGHSPAMADLFWVRSVLYFSQELRLQSNFEWLAAYIDLVIALDPYFEDIYKWAGAAMVVHTPKATVEQVRLANKILAQGAERFPDNYSLPLSAGSNCKFFARPKTPEEREEMEQCAKHFFTMAAQRPGAPPYMASLATQFQDKGESCGFLMSVYLKEHKDKKTLEQVRARLNDGFCDKTSAQTAIKYQETFEELYQQAPGYLSGDLWTQVGPLVQWELDQTKENTP